MVFENPQKPTSSNSQSSRLPIILLVNGYSIISVWPDLKKTRDAGKLDLSRLELIEVLVTYSSFHGYETQIIFDAQDKDESKTTKVITELLSVHYTEFGESADSHIEKICQSLQPELSEGLISRLIVVTSDKEQQLLVQKYDAEWISTQQLHGEVESTICRIRHRYQSRKQPNSRFLAYKIDEKSRQKLAHLRMKITGGETSTIQQTNIGSSSYNQNLPSLSEKSNIQFNTNYIEENQQPIFPQSTDDSQQQTQADSLLKPTYTQLSNNKKHIINSNALNALRIGNFKAFADTQYIPLRPLTLIFGANSSGKSSVLHSLLLSHHAIQTGELDIHWTKAGGESVDLGGFGQYVHKRDVSSKVEWAVDIDTQQINLADQELINLLKKIQKLTVGVSIGTRSGKGRVRVRSFFMEADGRRILNMSSRPKGRLQLDRLDYEHPIMHELINAILEANIFRAVSTEDYEEIKIIINELVPEINARISRFLPTKIQVGEEGNNALYQPNPKLGQPADLAEIVRLVLPYRLNNLIEVITDTIGQEITKLRYLGPFRTYPPRHFAFSRQQDVNWYAGGGYAWDILLNNSEVRQKVNAWLGDSHRMKTPYELKVRKLLSDSQLATELYPRLAKSLHDLTAKLIFHAAGFGGEIEEQVERLRGDLEAAGINLDNPDNFLPEIETLVSMMTDVDNVSETWVNEITDRGEKISDLVLMDKRTKTPVSHRDVGIGVSQVIPILVSCYGLSDALVAIEQPEIHLHPKLQAELGTVFAESIKPPYNNRFILETHSEHLILRLQRLIREGQLKPEDISVIYVDSDQEGSQCLELRLDEEGDFIDEWPDGFFEDDFKEIFS